MMTRVELIARAMHGERDTVFRLTWDETPAPGRRMWLDAALGAIVLGRIRRAWRVIFG